MFELKQAQGEHLAEPAEGKTTLGSNKLKPAQTLNRSLV